MIKVLTRCAAICMLVSGCATSYAPSGWMGGYDEIRLGPDIYKVSFKGNKYTSMERAVNYTLLRCAELALESGYRYFVIVESDQYTRVSAHTSSTQTTTTAHAYGVGNNAYGIAHSTTTGGDTQYSAKPRSTNVILMLKDKDAVNGLIYDAEFVAKSLREKYGLND